MKVRVAILKAFGKTARGGNLAGVVVGSNKFNRAQMQRIAKKVGYSETAFIYKKSDRVFNIRYFTPTKEVSLCGHATIAAFSHLYIQGSVKVGHYQLKTKAGLLDITVKRGGIILMSQVKPIYSELVSTKELAGALRIPEHKLAVGGLLPQIVSTGGRDIMVPIKSRRLLFSLKPNFRALARISKKTKSIGFQVFTFDTLQKKAAAHCRNFAPWYGINEESATGSSAGALGSYLFKYFQVPQRRALRLVFEQGYSMQKPSEILVELETKNHKVVRVKVGGGAILVKALSYDV